MSRDERASRAGVSVPPGIPAVLADGDLELLGLLPRSSNYAFLARATLGEEEMLAVYKPRRGENPLWDFAEGTLCNREAAAYLVAKTLGWPNVPPTLLRHGPEGEGAVQRFIPFEPTEHAFTLQQRFPAAFRRLALFDVIANNADRKSGHCLLGRDGRLFVVDHGTCFSEEPKLRTVLWDYVDEQIAAADMNDLRELRSELGAGHVRTQLDELLSAAEVRAVIARLEGLLAAGRFPEPGPGRPYPWPIV